MSPTKPLTGGMIKETDEEQKELTEDLDEAMNKLGKKSIHLNYTGQKKTNAARSLNLNVSVLTGNKQNSDKKRSNEGSDYLPVTSGSNMGSIFAE